MTVKVRYEHSFKIDPATLTIAGAQNLLDRLRGHGSAEFDKKGTFRFEIETEGKDLIYAVWDMHEVLDEIETEIQSYGGDWRPDVTCLFTVPAS